MRNIFIIVSILLLSACSDKNNKIVNADNVSLTFSVSKNYLLLPMEDQGEELQATIWINGNKTDTYVMRIAQNKVDYWMPVDLSAWKGKEMKLCLNKASGFLNEAKLSDVFDYDYNETYRPAYHFTPPYGWMNDPNGMVYYAGEYHLFYQYNPFGTRWQNMSWGHAVSADLVHWQHLPVALYPDSLGTIFSGSAVVDETNSAGFQTGGEKTLLAFYTQAERGGQWQSLAYSNDKGRTWTKYAQNPVLKKEDAPDFRDPKVLWYAPQNKWIMILAVGNHAEIYSSPDAKNWVYESSFGDNYGNHDGVWECPDLFEINGKWVMLINNSRKGDNSGSATQYFIGKFDGHSFKCDYPTNETHWLDYGKDHYALVTWANTQGNKRVGIAWLNNWEYANDLPTVNFRSAMSIPRELNLAIENNFLIVSNYPVSDIETIRGQKSEFTAIRINNEHTIENLPHSGVYELLIDFEKQNTNVFGFQLSNKQGECVDVCFNLNKKQLAVNREKSGIVDFNHNFSAITTAPITLKNTYQLRVLLDKCSIECFLDRGEQSISNLIFPHEPYSRISFYAKDGEFTVKKLEVYPLK